jgi:hypothetical protein
MVLSAILAGRLRPAGREALEAVDDVLNQERLPDMRLPAAETVAASDSSAAR